MKRVGTLENESAAPQSKGKVRTESNPDLFLGISDLPEVHAWIEKNNAEIKLKRRLKLGDFLNEAFCTFALEAVDDKSRVTLVQQFLQEFVVRHESLPRSATLSRVLYAWLNCGSLQQEGVALIRQLLSCRTLVPRAFALSCDEGVVTVALRLLAQASNPLDAVLLQEVLQLLPPRLRKRRVFSPLFAFANRCGDLVFALKMLELANESAIEFWDADYNALLTGIYQGMKNGTISALRAGEATETVLTVMSKHHSVVGFGNATLVKELLGGEETDIDERSGQGVCKRCGCVLDTFELTQAERDSLLDVILCKLIKPRIEGFNQQEPNKIITDDERRSRQKELDFFMEQLAQTTYDTVIDGANVGYYGLSSWYAQAKEALLRRRGVDPSTVSLLQRLQPPLHVDVAPKFSLIESMRAIALRHGKKPIIVLHRRHLEECAEENATLLQTWTEQRCLLSSPAFLNDDYCWLYAAIKRFNTFIISNDQMRDHHFSILSPRFFLRWRQRHRITYTAMFHPATGTTSLLINLPRPYSVWVQQASKGISRHWHLPFVSDILVLDQSTNRSAASERDVELNKDGDDVCSAWLCTYSKSL